MTVFKLKIIACISMLIDHIGAVILLPMLDEISGFMVMQIYLLTRGIGRIAFLIFAYLIAQGCLHTKNIGKYMLRLGILAIISEPLYDIAFRYLVTMDGEINFLVNTNIFYTLFLGVAAIAIYEKVWKELQKRGKLVARPVYINIIAVLAATPMMLASHLLSTSFALIGGIGVGLILLIYIMCPESHVGRCIAVATGLLVFYFGDINFLIYSLIAVGLIAFYNGKLGTKNAAIKWGFYFFYPVHLAILIIVRSAFLQG